MDNISLYEYGEVPAHLGISQQNWFDWWDGGETYEVAERAAIKHLQRTYGDAVARKIINKYDGDGSNKFVDIVATAEPIPAIVAEFSK